MWHVLRRALGAIALPLAVGAAVVPTPAAAQLAVTAIAIYDRPNSTQIALDLSRRVDYRAAFLNEPMRLVIDFPSLEWKLNDGRPSPRGFVAGYRFGRFDARTSRLVLDLAAPVRIRKAGFVLVAGKHGQRLVFELEAVDSVTYAGQVQPWSPSGDVASPAPTPKPAPASPGTPPITPPTQSQAAARTSAPTPVQPPSPSVVLPAPSLPTKTESSAPKPVVVAQTSVPAAKAVKPPSPRVPARHIVVIDPGHGGVDPGATGAHGTYEKDVTLAVARELRRQLEATGRHRAYLTRDGDEFVRLRDRIAKARARKAELFVSIHADSIGNTRTTGASIYTLSETASDSEAAALASRENRADIIAGVDLSHENPEVASILIDLAQRETMNLSAILAGLLVDELGRQIPLLPAKPHRFAGFAVLKAPDVPSVLIELGYLSNPEEERRLARPQGRARVAAGIVHAIDRYFSPGAGNR